jgi:hypothetical protein
MSHHLAESHRLVSYRLKLDALAAARREAEATQANLHRAKAYGATDEHSNGYTRLIKQSWDVTKSAKAKLDERREAAAEWTG